MTVRHHRGHDTVDDVLLPDDAALHLAAQIVGDLARAAKELDIPVGREVDRGRERFGEEVGFMNARVGRVGRPGRWLRRP